MAMGRRRKHDRHLPLRMYKRRGAYYFVDFKGVWMPLGRDLAGAFKKYGELVDGHLVPGTIRELWNRYEREELPKRSASTQRNRKQEMKRILRVFGDMQATDIEPHHGWTYFRERGEVEQARHELRALSALLTFARQVGRLKDANPLYALNLPGAQPRDRYVQDDEFIAFRERVPPMLGYAMDLAVVAGMDQSTILRLERRHITPEGLLFERNKTGARQLVEWNDELRLTIQAALREPPQIRRFVICRRDGKPYTPSGFRAIWQRLMRKYVKDGNARFTFHDLRAKSASDAATDQEAADRLGHTDARITRRVYRRLPRRAAALSILDSRPKNVR